MKRKVIIITVIAAFVVTVGISAVYMIATTRLSATQASYLVPQEYIAGRDAMDSPLDHVLTHQLNENTSLTPQIYRFSDMFRDYQPLTEMDVNFSKYQMASNSQYYDRIVTQFPTKNIRVFEENGRRNVYLVYMTDNGYTLYLFFGNGESMQRGSAVLMSKVLSYADFQNIKEGESTIDDVGKLEKAALLAKERYNSYPDGFFILNYNDFYTYRTPTTTFLLTDGVLTIHYAKADGKYVVKEMLYSKDFRVSTGFAEQSPDEKTPDELAYDWYKILPQDYITEVVGTGNPSEAWAKEDAKPEKPTPDEIDWSVTVEYKGESYVYTKEMAEKRTLTKTFASRYEKDNPDYAIESRMYSGVRLSEVLSDLGIPKASKITIMDTNGKEHALTPELAYNDASILGWIENNKTVIDESESYVAFCAKEGSLADFVRSVKSIVIE